MFWAVLVVSFLFAVAPGLVKSVACVMLSGVVLANSLGPVSAEELGEIFSTQNSMAMEGSIPSVGDLSLPTTAAVGVEEEVHQRSERSSCLPPSSRSRRDVLDDIANASGSFVQYVGRKLFDWC
ncbi:hypothetical protein [Pasteuria penetrans]|uniref:hypothetical protein n=1 Tax=Pasteuria penetrans TaxID=86005 RepID=UPI000FBD209E|nr:hypothetical protein [Pasteuria penetrans]